MAYTRISFLACLYVLVCISAAHRIPQKRWAVDDAGCRTPNRGIGNCVRISECSTMLDFLAGKKDFTERERNALYSYRCGAYRNEPKICCPEQPISLGWIVEEDRCRTPDGDDGLCIDVKDCKVIYDFIKQSPVDDNLRQTLKKYQCSTSANVRVCCPSSNKPPNLLPSGDDSKHPNVKLLPLSACGASGSTNKITNGNETSLFEFPWAASLKYDKDVNPWSCGGSLINDRYILTAAHCIRSKNKLTTVRLGEHNFDTDPDCETIEITECADPVQDFEISKDDAIVHPGYSETTLQDDIALIRLRRPANLTSYSVGPVCLPLTTDEKSIGNNFTVIGWGATETGFSSRVLLKVLVPKVNNTECAPKYASRAQLTDNQLCAGGRKEQDSCAGDSGGPLLNDFNVAGVRPKTIQYGIVSFGPRICGRENFPAVYTRVDKYVKWILDNIKP